MVCDEVQSGWARSGKMFASQYFADAGCAPDIMTTAKSIAAGLPISAVTARKEIMDAVTPGTIGGTFGANAVSAAAALKVIEIIERDDYCGKAMAISEKVTAKANEWVEKYDVVGNVRGMGAMMGIEFVTDKETKAPNAKVVADIVQYAQNKGLLLESAGTYGNVIRFLCPLCVTDEQLECGLAIFEEAIKACK